MMCQDAPQLWLRVPGRLRLANVVRRETTLETDRLRRHLGDFQTALPKARVCPETPKLHPVSPGDAPRHHNLPTAPYDYPIINTKKPAHSSIEQEPHLRRCAPSQPQIIKELRWWIDARHEQMIPRTGTGDVQHVAFRVVDLFQVSIVGHRLDPCLQGNDLIIARHHSNSTKLQAFGQMHRTDRNMAAG